MEESVAIRALVLDVVEAFNRGDVDAIAASFLPDDAAIVLGQHDDDWAEGREAIASLFRSELGRFRIVADEIRAWERGEVGWLVGRLRYLSDRYADQGRVQDSTYRRRGPRARRVEADGAALIRGSGCVDQCDASAMATLPWASVRERPLSGRWNTGERPLVGLPGDGPPS